MTEKRARAYMITGNNPEKYYEWAKPSTNEEYTDYSWLANEVIAVFVNGASNHNPRDNKINGAVCVVEVGKSKTLHFHLYVCCKNPIRFSALQKLFPHSQIDVLRGTVNQTLDYLHKRNKHKDFKGEQKCEPVYWGDYFCDNRGLTGNSVMDEIDEMLINGSTPQDIYATSPKLAFYSGAIEKTFQARRLNEIPNYQNVNVEYHLGKPGTGKTHTYLYLCEQGLSDNIYFVSGDYKNPWDLYDFTKHNILFLDELREGCLSTSTLLNITDGYKMILPARYSNRHKNWNKVIISSVIPPEKLFCSSIKNQSNQDIDTFEQFKRRLNKIIFHYIDDSFSGNLKYRFISISASEYTSIEELEKLAIYNYSNHLGQTLGESNVKYK